MFLAADSYLDDFCVPCSEFIILSVCLLVFCVIWLSDWFSASLHLAIFSRVPSSLVSLIIHVPLRRPSSWRYRRLGSVEWWLRAWTLESEISGFESLSTFTNWVFLQGHPFVHLEMRIVMPPAQVPERTKWDTTGSLLHAGLGMKETLVHG